MKEEDIFLPVIDLKEINSRNESHHFGNGEQHFIYKFTESGIITYSAGNAWESIGIADTLVLGSNAYKLFSFDKSYYNNDLDKNYGRFESKSIINEAEIHFEHVIVPNITDSNELLCLTTNITRSKYREQYLQRKLAEAEAKIALLEQKSEHKDKILAIVGHDLRSPLSSLASLLSVFDDDDIPEDLLTAKEILQKQLGSVNELVNNLLRWAARSFYEETADVVVPVNLHNIVRHNIHLITPSAVEKNLQLVNDIPDPLLARVSADQMDVVIRNLVLNAVKFTPRDGQIKFSSRVNNDSVEILVSDTGVGMTNEQLDVVFTHSHHSTYGTQGEKGFGLGLLLCKEYVAANKGSISIESKVKVGTTIKITLPVS